MINSAKKHVYYSKKFNQGPGGLGCNCCNLFAQHPRKSKVKYRRLFRHLAKQALREAKG